MGCADNALQIGESAPPAAVHEASETSHSERP